MIQKIVLAIIMAVTLVTGTIGCTDSDTRIVVDSPAAELRRPEPIDWGQVTPEYRLKADKELTAAERQAIRDGAGKSLDGK